MKEKWANRAWHGMIRLIVFTAILVNTIESLGRCQNASDSIAKSSLNLSALPTFQSSQHVLAVSLEYVLAQGATSESLMAWSEQNAAQLEAQASLATSIARQGNQAIPYITYVAVPSDASQTMKDFLQSRGILQNLHAQIYNEELQVLSAFNTAQIDSAFQTQNAVTLQTQAQRSQTLGSEAAQKPLLVPPPLRIPPGASRQMQAFLTLRDQLQRRQIAMHNQNLSLSAMAQKSAEAQWVNQNASELRQLQALSQNLNQ